MLAQLSGTMDMEVRAFAAARFGVAVREAFEARDLLKSGVLDGFSVFDQADRREFYADVAGDKGPGLTEFEILEELIAVAAGGAAKWRRILATLSRRGAGPSVSRRRRRLFVAGQTVLRFGYPQRPGAPGGGRPATDAGSTGSKTCGP